ncbi:MAG: S8/S53 family peptidase [Candidatus Eremiobacteraeota bacterium]|nr:S8/S53 family peptidase [Candidatus Eremiobacteraeota bacterium]
MRQILGAVAALTCAATIAASAQAATFRADTAGRDATMTRGFPMLAHSVDLGPVADAQPLRLVVGLQVRNRAAIDVLLRRQNTLGDPLYQHFLTPAQTTALFNPTGTTVQAVASYLNASGVRNLHVSPDNLLLTGDATAGVARRAFATDLHSFALNGRRGFANTRAATVPLALRGAIVSIGGLNSYAMTPDIRRPSANRAVGAQTLAGLRRIVASTVRPMATATPNPVNTPVPCNGVVAGGNCLLNAFNAQQFRTAYDVPPNPHGSGVWGYSGKSTAIAIFTEGKMTNVLSDLKLYEKANNLPTINPIVVNAGIPSPDVSGQDEFDLDTQSSTGIAQMVKSLYLYVATSLTDSDTTVAFDRFKTDDVAKAGSASFGSCEIFPATDGTLTTDDEIFAEAAVQGQTVFSSSGDNGTTCPVAASTGVPGTGLPAQSYPGVSPYVISVGGTSLVTSSTTGAYSSELAWEGSGGGNSLEDSSPFWQQGVVPAADNAPSGVPGVLTMKSVPDVAMDADPNVSPALIYVNGATSEVGGTSLASPLSLGVWSILESFHNNTLGFAGPLLYQEYKNHTTQNTTTGIYVPPTPPVGATTQLIGGFHDILIGSNGLPALPGYDQVTGLGSFDVLLQTKDLPTTYPH